MVIPWDTTEISDDDFPTAPDGLYELKITKADETVTKAKGYPAIVVRAEIVNSGKYDGIRIIHQVTIMPARDENGKPTPGAGIAKKFLKSIGEPYEGNINIVASNWEGKKFSAYVIRDTFEGKVKNKIKSVQSSENEAKEEVEVPF